MNNPIINKLEKLFKEIELPIKIYKSYINSVLLEPSRYEYIRSKLTFYTNTNLIIAFDMYSFKSQRRGPLHFYSNDKTIDITIYSYGTRLFSNSEGIRKEGLLRPSDGTRLFSNSDGIRKEGQIESKTF
jgi:hypothetical protein